MAFLKPEKKLTLELLQDVLNAILKDWQKINLNE